MLLSFQRPYKEVVSSTISGWIKKVLKLAKLDTDIYEAHSTRSASTSNVKLEGFSLSDILKEGHGQENLHGRGFITKILFTQKNIFKIHY